MFGRRMRLYDHVTATRERHSAAFCDAYTDALPHVVGDGHGDCDAYTHTHT